MRAIEAKQERVWRDLETHRRDNRGRIVDIQPYRMYCEKREGGSITVFEKPVGSGNLWYEKDGFFKEPAGRIGLDGKIKLGEAHIAFVPPETKDAKLASEVLHTQTTNAALQAELEAMRAEKAALEAQLKAQNATTPQKGK